MLAIIRMIVVLSSICGLSGFALSYLKTVSYTHLDVYKRQHVEYELNVPETGGQPDSLTFVEIDQEKCIGCDTCQQYCPTGAIYGETFEPHTIKYRELCINCGQCLTHCPSMAIYEVRSWVPKLEEKLKDSHVKCVAMPAPSVRYALGEAFGLPVGTVTTGKMLSALKALGFSHCWDCLLYTSRCV